MQYGITCKTERLREHEILMFPELFRFIYALFLCTVLDR